VYLLRGCCVQEVVTLDRIPPLDDANNEDDDRDYEKDVNVAAKRVGANESQKPKHEQNYEDRPEHGLS